VSRLNATYEVVQAVGVHLGRVAEKRAAAIAAKDAAQRAIRDARRMEWAHRILSSVADRKREEVRARVERIVQAALRAVFGPSISFRFDVSVLRGVVAMRPEVGFRTKDGVSFVGVDQVAGGVVDVVSLAVRVAVLLARRPRLRPVIVADEPLKHLSDEYLPQAAEMLRRLADERGLQIVVVSHEPDVTLRASAVHRVSRTPAGSTVRTEVQP